MYYARVMMKLIQYFLCITSKDVLTESKNKIRTLWGWKASKSKNIEPQRNFAGSYKKKCNIIKQS